MKESCPGIKLGFLRFFFGRKKFPESSKDFSILVGESIRSFAQRIHYQHKNWKNGYDVVGVLSSKKTCL